MDERERVQSSNEIASIVFDQVKRAWPDLHPVLDLRYGIADAVLAAGYRRADDSGTRSDPVDVDAEAGRISAQIRAGIVEIR
jgi:hypothetical protein